MNHQRRVYGNNVIEASNCRGRAGELGAQEHALKLAKMIPGASTVPKSFTKHAARISPSDDPFSSEGVGHDLHTAVIMSGESAPWVMVGHVGRAIRDDLHKAV